MMIVRATRRDSAALWLALPRLRRLAVACHRAGTWPSKPIRIICGYPAGGLTDIFARAYGDYISQKTGQPVFVENKAGASAAPSPPSR